MQATIVYATGRVDQVDYRGDGSTDYVRTENVAIQVPGRPDKVLQVRRRFRPTLAHNINTARPNQEQKPGAWGPSNNGVLVLCEVADDSHVEKPKAEEKAGPGHTPGLFAPIPPSTKPELEAKVEEVISLTDSNPKLHDGDACEDPA